MHENYQDAQCAQAGFGQSNEAAMKEYARKQSQYSNSATLADRPKQSPIEAALDLLGKRVEATLMEMSELRSRLNPVSIQSGICDKTEPAHKGRPPASCIVEQRIADITDAISSIAADIQATRNCLCV